MKNMIGMVAPRLRCFVLPALLGLVTTAVVAVPRGGDTRLLRELEGMERDPAVLCPVAVNQGELGRTVDKIADQEGAKIASGSNGSAFVEALNRLVFTSRHQGLPGSQGFLQPPPPPRVLERKQGYCVAIAALYLVLAERLQLPVYAVATPSHVFLRYDDGTTRINIETLQGAANVSDEQYIREQKIPERSIRRGVFMRNLTTDELLAQVHNNLGVIYSD